MPNNSELQAQPPVSMSRFNERGSLKRALEYRRLRTVGDGKCALTHEEAQQALHNGWVTQPTTGSCMSNQLS